MIRSDTTHAAACRRDGGRLADAVHSHDTSGSGRNTAAYAGVVMTSSAAVNDRTTSDTLPCRLYDCCTSGGYLSLNFGGKAVVLVYMLLSKLPSLVVSHTHSMNNRPKRILMRNGRSRIVLKIASGQSKNDTLKLPTMALLNANTLQCS